MTARPRTRASARTTTAPGTARSGPRVRDFATPATGFTVEWDVRSVFDFLFSLTGDAATTEDVPEADRTWLREARSGVAEDVKSDLETLFASQMGIYVAAYAVERPDVRTVDAFLDALATVPTDDLVRLHRALGDETRLRILRLLAEQDLYLTEIAQHLDLSKPTIKHHLAQLRAAGLLTVIESGAVIYYSLRRERIEAASTDLTRFLTP